MSVSNDIFISIVTPCFNEEGNIFRFYERIKEELDGCYQFELIFVDDGSTDQSLPKIKEIAALDSSVKFISFSRNFGHQKALKAGIDHAVGDAIITLDSDLQHPPQLIHELIKYWQEGYDVVYTRRNDQKNGSFFKRKTSRIFYKLFAGLSGLKIDQGAADFRLINRIVADELKKITEDYLFIRGLIAWMGFKQKSVNYIPDARFSGKTKYSLRKMLRFASAGITSMSVKPLRMSFYFGLFIALLSFIYGLYALYSVIFTENVLPGWGSTIASVLFIGGIQLILMGIFGDYLGKMFMENKRRPPYIVREKNTGNSQ